MYKNVKELLAYFAALSAEAKLILFRPRSHHELGILCALPCPGPPRAVPVVILTDIRVAIGGIKAPARTKTNSWSAQEGSSQQHCTALARKLSRQVTSCVTLKSRARTEFTPCLVASENLLQQIPAVSRDLLQGVKHPENKGAPNVLTQHGRVPGNSPAVYPLCGGPLLPAQHRAPRVQGRPVKGAVRLHAEEEQSVALPRLHCNQREGGGHKRIEALGLPAIAVRGRVMRSRVAPGHDPTATEEPHFDEISPCHECLLLYSTVQSYEGDLTV